MFRESVSGCGLILNVWMDKAFGAQKNHYIYHKRYESSVIAFHFPLLTNCPFSKHNIATDSFLFLLLSRD